MMRRSPGFTAVAVCSLAIGIGATSAIFSFADAMLLRPLPVRTPSRIAAVRWGAPEESTSISYPDYLDVRDRNRSFDDLVAFQYNQFGYAPTASVVPDMQYGMFVSGNFFRAFGVEPALGRAFRRSEDQAPGRDRVVVVSHDFWLAHLKGARSAIGSEIRLNGIPFTVIGVTPEQFTGIDSFLRPRFFVPLAMSPLLSGDDSLKKRDARWLDLKGRLKPGATMASAQADLNAIATDLKRTYPFEPRNLKVRVETELALRIEQSPPDAGLIEMLIVLAACVLIAACANVAGLLLSRSSARGREISVRLAVGASRWQLLRQLFVENLLLAVGGGVLGIAIALAGMQLFATIPVPTDVPIVFDAKLDGRVLAVTLGASILSSFLFGFVPAWRSTRPDVVSRLKARDSDGSRKGQLWGRNVLVSAQLAISCVLLLVSATVFFGFRGQLLQGPGFRTDRLLLMSFDTSMAHYTPAQNHQFFKQLLDRARSQPGVQEASLTSNAPFNFSLYSKSIVPEGHVLARGEQAPMSDYATVSDDYFPTMQIAIVKGRAVLPTDTATSTRIAVVNEHLAHHFWPTGGAVGKRFHLGAADGPLVEIVGIAKQSKYAWISEAPEDFLYLPFSQNEQPQMTLLTESKTTDAGTLVTPLRAVVRGLDSNMPIFDTRTMQDLFEKRAVQTPGIIVQVVACMGVMALVLAVIGLYGLISYSVSRRTREIGIRMAVGADRAIVLTMFMRQGFALALVGTVAGVAAGVAASRIIGSMLIFEGGSSNPFLFAPVVLTLLAAVLLAAYTPARRASKIDPMRALREE